MKRLALCIILLGSLVMSMQGCAPPPSPAELAAADYGPFPREYQQIVKAYIAATFKDPYSVQYEGWRGPAQGWMKLMGHTSYGYKVCVALNAKNSYGAYTGIHQHFFLINGPAVLHHAVADGRSIIDGEMVTQGCRDL